MILGEGVIISVGELLLTRKISTPGSYYLLVNNDPGSTYFRGVIIDGYTGILLNRIRINNTNRHIIARLNINSIRTKFNGLMKGDVDILCISETKVDGSFPNIPFYIEVFRKPLGCDRNSSEGNIAVFIREDIPCSELNKHFMAENIEGCCIELNTRKNKWFLFTGNNPHKYSISYFCKNIGKTLHMHISTFDNLILIGGFNSEIYFVSPIISNI